MGGGAFCMFVKIARATMWRKRKQQAETIKLRLRRFVPKDSSANILTEEDVKPKRFPGEAPSHPGELPMPIATMGANSGKRPS